MIESLGQKVTRELESYETCRNWNWTCQLQRVYRKASSFVRVQFQGLADGSMPLCACALGARMITSQVRTEITACDIKVDNAQSVNISVV
jgi:hypothetical protein